MYFRLGEKMGAKIERNGTCSFGKWNSFNNSRKDGYFRIYLVDFMLNTVRILELLATVSQLLSWHMKTLPYPVKPQYESMIYV